MISAVLGLGGFTDAFAQSAGNQVTGGAHVETEQANAGLPSTAA